MTKNRLIMVAGVIMSVVAVVGFLPPLTTIAAGVTCNSGDPGCFPGSPCGAGGSWLCSAPDSFGNFSCACSGGGSPQCYQQVDDTCDVDFVTACTDFKNIVTYTTTCTPSGPGVSCAAVGVCGGSAACVSICQSTVATTCIPVASSLCTSPPPPANIQVDSVNAVNGAGVSSNWVIGGPQPICGAFAACSGTSRVYPNIPFINMDPSVGDNYSLLPDITSIPAGYSFGGVNVKIARADNSGDLLGTLYNFLVKVARAVSVSPAGSQTLNTASGACPAAAAPCIGFTILWAPEAAIQVTPSLSLVNTTPGTVQISNIGAPGSGLDWSVASVTYVVGGGNASAALNISPGSGSAVAPGSPATVTIIGIPAAVSPSCWSPSSCQISVTLSGSSAAPGTASGLSASSIITLSVGSPVSVSVSPSSVTLPYGGTQAFTATVTGSGNTSVTWSRSPAGAGNITAGGLYTAPAATATAIVNATSSADPNQSGSATVNVVPPLSCQLIANPTTVVLPGTSTLTWSCINTLPSTTCSIDQGVGSVSPGGGSTPVSPATDTTYTLNCTTLSLPAVVSVQVRVNNPGVIEVPP